MSRHSRQEHKQAPIMDDGEVIFSVDEKLQSLIQFYWDHGVETFNSCEDNGRDTCWIEYALEDWMAICETAFRSEQRELHEFIQDACLVELLFTDDGHPDDDDDEYWIEGENLIWSASVRFPKELLPDFESMIRDLFSNLTPAEPGKRTQ